MLSAIHWYSATDSDRFLPKGTMSDITCVGNTNTIFGINLWKTDCFFSSAFSK